MLTKQGTTKCKHLLFDAEKTTLLDRVSAKFEEGRGGGGGEGTGWVTFWPGVC